MALQRVDLLLRDNVPNRIDNGEILVSLDYTHNQKGLMPLEWNMKNHLDNSIKDFYQKIYIFSKT